MLMWVQTFTEAKRQCWKQELELQAIVNHPKWVLGTALRSVRAASVPNYQTSLHSPTQALIQNFSLSFQHTFANIVGSVGGDP